VRSFTAEFAGALSLAFLAYADQRPGVYFEWLDRDRFSTPEDLQFMLDSRDGLWPEAALVVVANSDAVTARVRQASRAVATSAEVSPTSRNDPAMMLTALEVDHLGGGAAGQQRRPGRWRGAAEHRVLTGRAWRSTVESPPACVTSVD